MGNTLYKDGMDSAEATIQRKYAFSLKREVCIHLTNERENRGEFVFNDENIANVTKHSQVGCLKQERRNWTYAKAKIVLIPKDVMCQIMIQFLFSFLTMCTHSQQQVPDFYSKQP